MFRAEDTMAKDANEGTGGGPLAASIRAQLRAKEQLEEEAQERRRASDRARARTERQKEEQRAIVGEHLAAAGADSPEGWRKAREAARQRGRIEARRRDWVGRGLPLAGIALALAGVAFGRRALVYAGLPLLAAAVVLRNRLPRR